MTLVGIDLAFDYAETHDVEEDFVAKVAPPKVITVLKMVAYLDRPQERRLDRENETNRGVRCVGSATASVC